MRKIVIILLIVGIVLGSIPATTGLSFQKNNTVRMPVVPVTKPLDNETPPDWATGNFSGVWGLNIAGQPLPPVGWVAGYYSDMGLGRFLGVFALFNQTNVSGFIGGILLGPFMLGVIGNITTGNQTFFVGLGGANTTNFYWRIMGFVGPTFYMYGNYTKFHNTTQMVVPRLLREKSN